MSRQGQPSGTFTLSECPGGPQGDRPSGFLTHLYSDTSYTAELNLGAAVQIGQRLADIGDELNRTYESQFQSKITNFVRTSMWIVNNCQACVLSVLRSIRSRVDRGASRTAGQLPLEPAAESGSRWQNLLLTFVLITASGIFIKLALED